MSEIASVHVWGFFDDDGNRKLPSGAAPSDLNVFHHHNRVWINVGHFGGDVHRLRAERTLDGLLVRTEFETPGHDRTDPMWHVITVPGREWADPTTPQPARTPRPAAQTAEKER